jgi:hypothetical protein
MFWGENRRSMGAHGHPLLYQLELDFLARLQPGVSSILPAYISAEPGGLEERFLQP